MHNSDGAASISLAALISATLSQSILSDGDE